MNLELYRAFYFIAKSGSISKAAEQLFITQPAVSRAVKQLEDALGCVLFFRTSKGVKLTPEGTVLFQYIDQAFNFIFRGEKKINEVKSLQFGEIRIGVSDTLCKYYLAPYLKLFNTLYPGIKIQVTSPTTPVIISLIKSGKVDFGIVNLPVADDQLEINRIMEIQDCLVAGKKYRHLSYQMQPLNEIVKYPLLFLERNSNSRRYIDQYFKRNNVVPSPDFELGNFDLLIHFAKNDFGIACVIKNFIQEDLDRGNLYEVKPIEKIPPRHVGIARLAEVPLSAAAQELIRHLEFVENSEI
ncbi:MAG TPA: LysR family transcriptional regulator [Bacillota bacterium]|nr:LysR family transcriptional regulator [Bacillota bacterium]